MAEANENDKPLGTIGMQGPAQEFLTFCAEERDRRSNSGEPFDEAVFDEAVTLVRRRLEALAGEDVQ